MQTTTESLFMLPCFQKQKERTPCQTLKGVQIPLLVLLPHPHAKLRRAPRSSMAIETLAGLCGKSNTARSLSFSGIVSKSRLLKNIINLATGTVVAKRNQFRSENDLQEKQAGRGLSSMLSSKYLGYRRNRAIMSINWLRALPTQEWKCGAIDHRRGFPI